MSTTTIKLRKTLVILVSIALLLAPNIIAFADDDISGEQGTPTPEVTVEVSTEPGEALGPEETPTPVPSDEVSEEPTETPTPAPSDEEPPVLMAMGLDGGMQTEDTHSLYFDFPSGCNVASYSYVYYYPGGTLSGTIYSNSSVKSIDWARDGRLIDVTATKVTGAGDFQSWSIPNGDSSLNPTSFTMPNSNTHISASFASSTTYDLTFNAADGLDYYLVSGDSTHYAAGSSKTSITEGTTVTVSAVALPSHNHVGWTIPDQPTNNGTVSVTMDDDKSVQALFELKPPPEHTLTFEGSNCYYTVDGDATHYDNGDKIENIPDGTVYTVTAHPVGFYAFNGWTHTPSGATGTNPITFTMNNDDYVQASMTAVPMGELRFYDATTGLASYSYSWTYGSLSGSGTIDSYPHSGSGGACYKLSAPAGASITVTANGQGSYAWSSWTHLPSGAPASNPSEFSMPSSDWIQANMHEVITDYDMFFDFHTGLASYSYTVDGVSQADITYEQHKDIPVGTTVIVTANAAPLYVFDEWDNDTNADSTSGNTATFVMYGDKESDARFVFDGYHLTLAFGIHIQSYTVEYDTVSLNITSGQTLDLPKNVSVTVTANPAIGHVFDYWADTGHNPPTDGRNGNKWTFTMDGDYSLKANGDQLSGEKFQVKYEDMLGSGSGSIKVYYPVGTYKATLTKGQSVDITYQTGQNKVKVEAVPTAGSGFVKWTNYGVTTPVMEIDLITGQGTGITIECDVTIYIKLKPEFVRLGSLAITKKDQNSGAVLPGAVFELKNSSGAVIPETGNGTSDGTFYWGSLPQGTYTLKETQQPAGYKMPSPNEWTVVIGAGGGITTDCVREVWDVTGTIENESDHCSLAVNKVDSETGAVIEAYAKFRLTGPNGYSNEQESFDGTFFWDDLEPGDYQLTELDAPDGYYWETQTHNITLTSGESGEKDIDNYEYGSITVYKRDSVTEEFLEGATFELVNDSEPGTPIAGNDNGNGTFTWTDLKAGSYTLTETGVPAGYYDASHSEGISLSVGEDKEITVDNEKFVSIQIIKRDNRTGTPLADAEFSIEEAQGGVVLGTVTTGPDGKALFAYPDFELRAGVLYLIKEVQAPYGYFNDSTPVYISIPTPGGINDVEDAEFRDNPDLGRITVAKFQAGTNFTTRIPGVVFRLYKDSVAPANQIGTDQITDINGNASWGGLYAGTYILKEISVPYGYTMPAVTETTVILAPGSTLEDGREIVIIENEGPPTTTTPPTNPPESTPTPAPSPTPTPVPTATPTPVNTEEVTIEDVDPAFGPETGEGTGLFMTIGILLLMASALFIIRKKAVLKGK